MMVRILHSLVFPFLSLDSRQDTLALTDARPVGFDRGLVKVSEEGCFFKNGDVCLVIFSQDYNLRLCT
jgi:hypothetical protein